MDNTWWTKPDELDAEQRAVVALPKTGDHLVIGPPGSGKTNLLLLRASFLHKSGTKNIVVITFGRVLREFLASGAANYPFSADKIQTYMRWASTLISTNGFSFNARGEFDEVRGALLDKLRSVADLNDPANIYDCLLIDEVQDLTIEELRVIRRLARQMFAVGDSRQKIYGERLPDGTDPISYLQSNFSSTKPLTAHYRNGIKVCRVADGIQNLIDSESGIEASSNYDEASYPSSVQSEGGLTIQDQVNIAVAEINTQLRAYPSDFIGIICPRLSELDVIWNAIQGTAIAPFAQLQKYDEGYAPFSSDRRVIVTSLHAAKGLEFRALHLLGMDYIKRFPLQRNIAYTAVTRAKTSLRLYHDDSLPGYLENGLAAISSSHDTATTLDDLFMR